MCTTFSANFQIYFKVNGVITYPQEKKLSTDFRKVIHRLHFVGGSDKHTPKPKFF